MTTTPCKECEKRFVGCHGSCIEYKNAKKRIEEEKMEIRKAKFVDGWYTGMVIDARIRHKKNHR